MKTFFDGIFMDSKMLNEEGIQYPIRLEYYKTVKEEENVVEKYGIEIVKIEYKDGRVDVERKEIKNISTCMEDLDKILTILRDNEVTPIAVQDILDDIFITA